MKKFLLTAFSALALAFGAQAQDTFIPLTNTSQLTDGTECVLVYKGATSYILGTKQNSNNRAAETLSEASINADGSVTPGATAQIITLQSLGSSWILKTEEDKCLTATANSSNYLRTGAIPTADGVSTWSITIEPDGSTQIKAVYTAAGKYLQYNSQNNLFSCYNNTQKNATLYVKR